jgi:hypothetical protein
MHSDVDSAATGEWIGTGENDSLAQTTTNGTGTGTGTLKRVGTDRSARTLGRTESIGSRVGSVRKRLSMLKLGGKKTGKGGVDVVDRVAEE